MVYNDIELVDNDYIRIPIGPNRKIKFKGISFKNILSRFKNFRLERLKQKLAEKKENLVEMEFTGNQLDSHAKRERIERKILHKTKAIARLESKISFLETGNYYSEEFVDSRSIKLKELMMKNLIYNCDSLYSVKEEIAEKIMNENSIDSIINAETEKIGERVRKILEEKAIARKAAAKEKEINETVSIPPIEPELSKNTTPISNEGISAEEINKAIDKSMAKINVNPVVSPEEVAEAIDIEMQKIKVSGNESTPAKVNKFINEDGTYRLRREDIDEDFRITRFDRVKLPIEETTPVQAVEEPEIPPFNTTAAIRKAPDVELPKKAITAIVERKTHEFPKIILPTIRESFDEPTDDTIERETPVVVPERNNINVNQNLVSTIDNEQQAEDYEEYSELGNLMQRVRLLQAEQDKIATMTEAAKQKANSVDSAYREMRRRLQDYANSLEAACNESYKSIDEVEKTAATKEEKINAMIEIMAYGETPTSAKGRNYK